MRNTGGRKRGERAVFIVLIAEWTDELDPEISSGN
jgi:hypothetical protein